MADFNTTKAAIKTKLETVTDIGKVYDRERFAKNAAVFKILFFDSGISRINGWFFYRTNTQELELDNGAVRRIDTWKFFGFIGIEDADDTESMIQVRVEDIATAFRADPTLGGVIEDNKDMAQENGPVGIQVLNITPVMLGGVLCHRAELELKTETSEVK